MKVWSRPPFIVRGSAHDSEFYNKLKFQHNPISHRAAAALSFFDNPFFSRGLLYIYIDPVESSTLYILSPERLTLSLSLFLSIFFKVVLILWQFSGADEVYLRPRRLHRWFFLRASTGEIFFDFTSFKNSLSSRASRELLSYFLANGVSKFSGQVRLLYYSILPT